MSSITERNSFIYLLLSLLIFIWGLNFSLVKWAVSEIAPLPFNVVRHTLASLVILVVLLLWKGWRPISFTDGLKFLGLGIIGHTLYQVLFIKGISLTTAGNSSLFIATSPIWTGLLSAGLGKDELGVKVWAGTILGFIGVVLVTLGGNGINFSGSGTLGDVLTLLAAVSLATYTVTSRDLLEKYSPLRLTAITMTIGSVGLWIFAFTGVIEQNWSTVPVRAWGVLIYSALLAVVLGYLIWFTAVKAVGPSRTAIFNNMTPIVAFALAFVLLGEPVAPLQVVGGIIVLVGIGLTVRN